MDVQIVVKRNNPIIVDESDESRTKYDLLKKYAGNLGYYHIVLDVDAVRVLNPFSRTWKYPKAATLEWLFKKLRDTMEAIDQKEIWSKVSKYKPHRDKVKAFFDLAEKLTRDGGVVTVNGNDITLEWRTYSGTLGGIYNELPQPLQLRIDLLSKRNR